MAEGQAMKALLNEAFGGGEYSPNPFVMELRSAAPVVEGATTLRAGFRPNIATQGFVQQRVRCIS